MIEKVINCILIFILALMVSVMLYLTYLEVNKVYPDKDVCGFSSQVEYENFERLHRFHGTLSSWTENGTCVYKRDGQLCSLWDPLVRTDR